MKELYKNPDSFKPDNEKLKIDMNRLLESNTLHLWNSYISNSNYLVCFKQFFSVLVFLCLENKDYEDGKFIIEKITKALVKLS